MLLLATKNVNDMNWFVYIVRCNDGTLYTGISNDLNRRIAAHNKGSGAKYTRPASRRPVKLVYSRACGSQSDAAKDEFRIKGMSRQNKELMITNPGCSARPWRRLHPNDGGRI